MSIPQCIISEFPTHPVIDSLEDFDWVLLEIIMKDCIVGMFVTCCINIISFDNPMSKPFDEFYF